MKPSAAHGLRKRSSRQRWLPWSCAVLLLGTLHLPSAEFASARLGGRVTDSAGKPLEAVRVFVNRSSGTSLENIRDLHADTDAQGRYELTVRFAQGTLVLHEVFAEKKGYARAAPAMRLRLKDEEKADLPFVLEEGKILAGRVQVPLSGQERAGRQTLDQVQRVLQVSGAAVDKLSGNARAYLTEPGGRFEFYLPDGEYTLHLLAYGTEPVSWKGIRSGRNDLVLELPAFEWTEASVGRVYDELWEAMDRQYSYFTVKPEVDWKALGAACRPKAVAARDSKELSAALRELLAPLRDMHVWIEPPEGGRIPTHRSGYEYNGNRQVTRAQLQDETPCGRFAVVARTREGGFGYFLMLNQGAATEADVQKAIAAVDQLRSAPGFVVDLRNANGGSEPLAARIATRFCAQETVYAKSKYRNGPAHDAFGSAKERRLPASSQPYTKPVVCLIGPGAVSSGEGFVQMMRCLKHVTTVGRPTRGASGNPGPHTLGLTGLTVYFSRWVDLLPDGSSFEGIGIAPAIEVREPAEAYAAHDLTLERGLQILRQQVEK